MNPIRKVLMAGALAGTALLGGVLGASMLGSAGAQTSTTTAPSAGASGSTAAPDPGHGPHQANGITETELIRRRRLEGDCRRAGRGTGRLGGAGRDRRRRRRLRGPHDQVGRLRGHREAQQQLRGHRDPQRKGLIPVPPAGPFPRRSHGVATTRRRRAARSSADVWGACLTKWPQRTALSTPAAPKSAAAQPRRPIRSGESVAPELPEWDTSVDGRATVGDGHLLVHRSGGFDAPLGRSPGRDADRVGAPRRNPA